MLHAKMSPEKVNSFKLKRKFKTPKKDYSLNISHKLSLGIKNVLKFRFCQEHIFSLRHCLRTKSAFNSEKNVVPFVVKTFLNLKLNINA
jgi:hypothetical protein